MLEESCKLNVIFYYNIDTVDAILKYGESDIENRESGIENRLKFKCFIIGGRVLIYVVLFIGIRMV